MVEFEYLINLLFVLLQIYGIVSVVAFLPAMIDIFKSKKNTKYKLVWLAICLILGVFGVFVYFLIEKRLRFRR
ncbi:MAG: PLDc N-terminal domain-containing protein [Candidatus Aenigmatarchaeota archaeon]